MAQAAGSAKARPQIKVRDIFAAIFMTISFHRSGFQTMMIGL